MRRAWTVLVGCWCGSCSRGASRSWASACRRRAYHGRATASTSTRSPTGRLSARGCGWCVRLRCMFARPPLERWRRCSLRRRSASRSFPWTRRVASSASTTAGWCKSRGTPTRGRALPSLLRRLTRAARGPSRASLSRPLCARPFSPAVPTAPSACIRSARRCLSSSSSRPPSLPPCSSSGRRVDRAPRPQRRRPRPAGARLIHPLAPTPSPRSCVFLLLDGDATLHFYDLLERRWAPTASAPLYSHAKSGFGTAGCDAQVRLALGARVEARRSGGACCYLGVVGGGGAAAVHLLEEAQAVPRPNEAYRLHEVVDGL